MLDVCCCCCCCRAAAALSRHEFSLRQEGSVCPSAARENAETVFSFSFFTLSMSLRTLSILLLIALKLFHLPEAKHSTTIQAKTTTYPGILTVTIAEKIRLMRKDKCSECGCSWKVHNRIATLFPGHPFNWRPTKAPQAPPTKASGTCEICGRRVQYLWCGTRLRKFKTIVQGSLLKLSGGPKTRKGRHLCRQV